MTMYKFIPVTTGMYPNQSILTFKQSQDNLLESDNLQAQEVSRLEGWHYVWVPDGVTISDQDSLIQWQPVIMTAELLSKLRSNSDHVTLIDQQFQESLRGNYSLDDELYFTRIGTGKSLGLYEFQPGELEKLTEYGLFVEGLRTISILAKSSIGL